MQILLRIVCIVRITSPELPPMAVQYRCHVSLSVSRDQYTVLPLDTLNPDCLIYVPNVGTFDFLLILSFGPMRVLSLIFARAKFKMSWLLIGCSAFSKRHSDWLNFIHFPGYRLKIKIILRLIKRGDQALISISTILKETEGSEFCELLFNVEGNKKV